MRARCSADSLGSAASTTVMSGSVTAIASISAPMAPRPMTPRRSGRSVMIVGNGSDRAPVPGAGPPLYAERRCLDSQDVRGPASGYDAMAEQYLAAFLSDDVATGDGVEWRAQ